MCFPEEWGAGWGGGDHCGGPSSVGCKRNLLSGVMAARSTAGKGLWSEARAEEWIQGPAAEGSISALGLVWPEDTVRVHNRHDPCLAVIRHQGFSWGERRGQVLPPQPGFQEELPCSWLRSTQSQEGGTSPKQFSQGTETGAEVLHWNSVALPGLAVPGSREGTLASP